MVWVLIALIVGITLGLVVGLNLAQVLNSPKVPERMNLSPHPYSPASELRTKIAQDLDPLFIKPQRAEFLEVPDPSIFERREKIEQAEQEKKDIKLGDIL